MLHRLLDAVSILLFVLVVIALVLLVAAAGTAGVLLVGRLVGGLFGVGTIETTAVALVVSLAIGLTLFRLLVGPSDNREVPVIPPDMVPIGDDEPERPDYDGEGLPHCPYLSQRLDLPPASRAERRRR